MSNSDCVLGNGSLMRGIGCRWGRFSRRQGWMKRSPGSASSPGRRGLSKDMKGPVSGKRRVRRTSILGVSGRVGRKMTDRRERDKEAFPGLDGMILLRAADSDLMFLQSVGHTPSGSGGEPGHHTLHQSGAEGLEGPVESGGRKDSSRSQEMRDHRAAASGRERRNPSISQIMRNRS